MIPVTYAILADKMEVFKALLTSEHIELNPKEVVEGPLRFACNNERLEYFKILLDDPRVDVNQPFPDLYLNTPLTWSLSLQKPNYFKALLEFKKRHRCKQT